MELDNLNEEDYARFLAAFKGKGKGKGGFTSFYGKRTYSNFSKGYNNKGGGGKGTKGGGETGGVGGQAADGQKGKGKGGGFVVPGNCSCCGKWGHTQRYCRKKERDWYGGAPANSSMQAKKRRSTSMRRRSRRRTAKVTNQSTPIWEDL